MSNEQSSTVSKLSAKEFSLTIQELTDILRFLNVRRTNILKDVGDSPSDSSLKRRLIACEKEIQGVEQELSLVD